MQSSSAADSCEPVKLIWLFSLAKVLRVADAPEGRKKKKKATPHFTSFLEPDIIKVCCRQIICRFNRQRGKVGPVFSVAENEAAQFSNWLFLVPLVAFPAGQRCQSLHRMSPNTHELTCSMIQTVSPSSCINQTCLVWLGGGTDGCLGSVSVMQ